MCRFFKLKYFTGGWIYLALIDAVPLDEVHERLQTEWTTVGVVAALVCSIYVGPFIEKIDPAGFSDFLQWIFAMVTIGAFAMPASTVLLDTAYYVALNLLDKRKSVMFVEKFHHLLMLPNALLVGGILCGLVQAIFVAIINFGPIDESITYIAIISCSLGVFFCIIAFAYIFYQMYKKGGLASKVIDDGHNNEMEMADRAEEANA